MTDPMSPTTPAELRALIDKHLDEWWDNSPIGTMLVTGYREQLSLMMLKFAASALEASAQETARLREALVRVRAHTSYTIPASGKSADLVALLSGLLQSIERITDEGLRTADATPSLESSFIAALQITKDAPPEPSVDGRYKCGRCGTRVIASTASPAGRCYRCDAYNWVADAPPDPGETR